jgi:hypothetical protein
MSTATLTADVKTGQEVVLPERGPSELTEPKFTAAQIEAECPPRLQAVGRGSPRRRRTGGTCICPTEEIADDRLF